MEPNTITAEELLKILTVVVIPVIAAVVWITALIYSVKSDVQTLEAIVKAQRDNEDSRISKLERNIHDLRNLITKMMFSFSKEYKHNDDDD